MSEYLGPILLIGIIIAIIFIDGYYRDKKAKEKFIIKLKENYGKINPNELTEGDVANIGYYHQMLINEDDFNEFSIDDITWNDLGLDSIFCKMDTCLTGVGEEELYHILHCPNMNENASEKHLSELIEYFDTNDDDRLSVQKILGMLGINRKTSVTKIYNYMQQMESKSNVIHYALMISVLVTIALIFLKPGIGVLLFFGAMFVSVGVYLKSKRDMDIYISTFNYTCKMLKEVDRLDSLKLDIISDEVGRMIELKKPLRKLERNMVWLSSGAVSMDNPAMLLMEYIKMLFHIDIIKFNNMVSLIKSNENEIATIRRLIGRIDASIAIASYRRSFDEYCIPEFSNSAEAEFSVEDIVHPLLSKPVANSISTKRPILLTGSNASGKSTFLKSVAIAAVFAQTMHFVPAKSYRASRFKIYTSMALNDSIHNGESYFIVEIKSLKRILEAGNKGEFIFCCIDEVLRGTNTVERIAASTKILESLVKSNIIAFAATHDIELTQLLENSYTNYHFEEEVKEHDVEFNYLLKNGKAVSRNAIKLLQVMDYDSAIINSAENMVDEFVETGIWNNK